MPLVWGALLRGGGHSLTQPLSPTMVGRRRISRCRRLLWPLPDFLCVCNHRRHEGQASHLLCSVGGSPCLLVLFIGHYRQESFRSVNSWRFFYSGVRRAPCGNGCFSTKVLCTVPIEKGHEIWRNLSDIPQNLSPYFVPDPPNWC